MPTKGECFCLTCVLTLPRYSDSMVGRKHCAHRIIKFILLLASKRVGQVNGVFWPIGDIVFQIVELLTNWSPAFVNEPSHFVLHRFFCATEYGRFGMSSILCMFNCVRKFRLSLNRSIFVGSVRTRICTCLTLARYIGLSVEI